MPALTRRDVFANLLSCYHNSFEGRKGDVYEHSPDFIRRVVQESGAQDLALATLRLDPRLTSTDQGAVAFAVAKAVSENKLISPSFIDMELTEGVLTAYFDAKAVAEKIERVLADVGRVGIVAKPGDEIHEGVVSDMYIVMIEPTEAVAESIVTESKKRYPPKMKKDDKKDDKDDCDEGEKERAYVPVAECVHFDLAEDVFGDELLVKCAATPEAVKEAFVSVFNKKGMDVALSATINESDAPASDDAAGQRNRLLRVLAGRGYLAQGAHGFDWSESAEKAIKEAIAKFAEDKWTIVEGAGRSALTNEDYEASVDAVAESIHESVGEEVFENYFDRVVDSGVVEMTDAKRAELIRKISEAAEKDDKILPRVLRGLARAAMFERGMYASANICEAMGAWAKYVEEATKAPAEPKNLADDLVADVLGA